MNTTTHTSPYSAWSGFVIGIIAGFVVSSGLIGFAVGYSVSGSGSRAAAPAPAPSAAPAAAGAPAKNVRVADKTDHILGNANAAVTVIEYSDFECPFCRRHFTTIEGLAKKYGNDVNIVYRHYPLSFHPSAQKAAEGSECAAELGGEAAFWKFHDAIFQVTKMGLDQIVPTAKAIGLDEAKFKACLDSGKYEKKVKDQMTEGSSFGVRGTPGNFVINNKTKEQQFISGAVPQASFEAAIDPILGKK